MLSTGNLPLGGLPRNSVTSAVYHGHKPSNKLNHSHILVSYFVVRFLEARIIPLVKS